MGMQKGYYHVLFLHGYQAKEAFDTFSRYQDLKVEFKNKNFENKLFSGKFNTLEIDKFLFAIQKIYPIKIVKSENKITVN